MCVGLGLENGWNEKKTFWWATGQRLLSYSATDSNGLVGRQPLFNLFGRQPFFDLLQTINNDSNQSYAIYSPASYVDDAAPLRSPCTPEGVLETNATGTNCKVYVFHHLYIDKNWRSILVDQLVKVIFSGLYDRATAVFSTLSGRDARAMEEASQLIHSFGGKFQILDQQLNSDQYERLTLHQIKKHVSDEDLVYYFHLKGGSTHFWVTVSRFSCRQDSARSKPRVCPAIYDVVRIFYPKPSSARICRCLWTSQCQRARCRQTAS